MNIQNPPLLNMENTSEQNNVKKTKFQLVLKLFDLFKTNNVFTIIGTFFTIIGVIVAIYFGIKTIKSSLNEDDLMTFYNRISEVEIPERVDVPQYIVNNPEVNIVVNLQDELELILNVFPLQIKQLNDIVNCDIDSMPDVNEFTSQLAHIMIGFNQRNNLEQRIMHTTSVMSKTSWINSFAFSSMNSEIINSEQKALNRYNEIYNDVCAIFNKYFNADEIVTYDLKTYKEESIKIKKMFDDEFVKLLDQSYVFYLMWYKACNLRLLELRANAFGSTTTTDAKSVGGINPEHVMP